MDTSIEKPCVRGCAEPSMNEDEEPLPKAATHGLVCSSCYYRLKHALTLAPDLIMMMRTLITPTGVRPMGERRGSSETPTPLRITPLDDADALYAKLVLWTEVIAGHMRVPQPSAAAWINFREIQGFRPVTPVSARDLTQALTDWFDIRLESICYLDVVTEFHDDLCWGWEDNLGVFRLHGRYPLEPRPVPQAERRECPMCGERDVFVVWPEQSKSGDIEVLCGKCAWLADTPTLEVLAA